MSLNSRDFTQGGQVLKYMIGMFLQIMNIAVYWIFLLSLLVFVGWLFVRMTYEQIVHGTCYWFIKWFVIPTQHSFHSGQKTPYTFHYTNADGTVLTFKRRALEVMADPYFVGVGERLKESAFWGWGLASFTFVGGIFAVTWYLGRKGRLQREDEMLGGRDLVEDPQVINKILKKQNRLSDLSIGGMHLPAYSEMQGFGLHGTVGTGKSTAINEFLAQLRARGDRVCIYDKGNNFVPLFYRQDKDILLNGTDERCAPWDLWEECLTTADFENFATAMVPHEGGGDPFWLMSARNLFAGGAIRMAKDGARSIASLLKKLLSISLADLREYLKDTDVSNLVEGSIEKTAMTIRTVLATYVRSLRYLQGLDETGKRPFNLRDWIATEDAAGDNPWVFITSDGRNHNALKPLLTAWLYLTMVNILGLSANRDRRVWLYLDELPSLQKLPILPEFIAESRKFGGCTFIAIQNFSQLKEVYGTNFAEALWDLVNTHIYFRAPSATIAEWVRDEIGEKRLLKFKDQYSYGVDIIRDGVSFAKDDVKEHLVSYSDVQRLNDLQCYITLPGDFPVVKMNLKRKEYRDVAEGHIPRNLKDIFDPVIEKKLEEAEAESGGMAAKLIDKLFSSDEESASGEETASESSPGAEPSGTPQNQESEGRSANLAFQPQPAFHESTIPASAEPVPSQYIDYEEQELMDENQNLRHRDESIFEIER